MIDYFTIIHKYVPPDSPAYQMYITHVHMVTKKALTIAKRLELSNDQIRFVEEASMLHDIGMVKTDDEALH